MSDLKNVLLAVALTIAIIFGWQFFYDGPRQKIRSKQKQTSQVQKVLKQESIKKTSGEKFFANRNEALKKSGKARVKRDSPKVKGSISLVGARFDDLVLPKYRATFNKNSGPTILLSPSMYKEAYFVEFGWLSDDGIDVPTAETIWNSNKETLKANGDVTLSWKNSQNMEFKIHVALDNNYMFKITQTVKNQSGKPIVIRNYGLINRIFGEGVKSRISYEGPIGVFNDILKEVSYKDLESDKIAAFENNSSGSWLGASDKYWLTAIAPREEAGEKFDAKFQYAKQAGKNKFQIDYLSEKKIIESGAMLTKDINFFAGAKVL